MNRDINSLKITRMLFSEQMKLKSRKMSMEKKEPKTEPLARHLTILE